MICLLVSLFWCHMTVLWIIILRFIHHSMCLKLFIISSNKIFTKKTKREISHIKFDLTSYEVSDLKLLVGDATDWTVGALYPQEGRVCRVTHLKVGCEHTPPGRWESRVMHSHSCCRWHQNVDPMCYNQWPLGKTDENTSSLFLTACIHVKQSGLGFDTPLGRLPLLQW